MTGNKRTVWKHPAFFYLVCAVFICLVIQFFLRLAIVHGPSMNPTLSNGDIVVVWQWNYHPETGDIVVTNTNNPFDVRLTKRVASVGEETDTAEGDQDFPVTNGKVVFLLGDNTDQSRDSREIGAVSEDDLMGKVVARVYPFNKMCIFYD